MRCSSSHPYVIRSRLPNIIEKEGSLAAVNFCRSISISSQVHHAIPYLELGIPFILSSDGMPAYRDPTVGLRYINSEVKNKGGLAVLGQTNEMHKHFPVSLKTIDFLIEQVKKGTRGKTYRLQDFL